MTVLELEITEKDRVISGLNADIMATETATFETKKKIFEEQARSQLQTRYDELEAENGRFRDLMRMKGITNAELLGIDSVCIFAVFCHVYFLILQQEVVDSKKFMVPIRGGSGNKRMKKGK